MKFYKDAQNTVYAYEADGSQDSYILDGLTAITDEEADLLRAKPAEPVPPAAQIDALERHHMLPRPVRDVMLGLMEKEAAALGLTPEQLRLANPGYRRVKELDEQIAALRALL